jgi:thiol-disulfide isomerase/thioredoxin
VLDFWTYCCINCLHTLAVLAELEAALALEPVLFVGVHTAKFPSEEDPARVADAIRRHGVRHPVVVDVGRHLREAYAIRSWPTLVVVDPAGRIVATEAGEPDAGALARLITHVVAEARRAGHPLAAGRLPLRPTALPEGPLAFPGKLVAHGAHLFVADTDHHQIVECSLGRRPLRLRRSRRRRGLGAAAASDGHRRPRRRHALPRRHLQPEA